MSDLERKLARKMARATHDYQLIEDGDRIMVGISGGKDSWVLLHLLRRAQRIAPIQFELVAFHLDQGHPGFPTDTLREHLEAEGVEYVIHSRDTYSVVKEKLQPGQTTCSLCSRLRRGILYGQAQELGCNKIALGHHRDDIVETLLLNLFFTGQLKAMPPKLISDDKKNTVIRPLAYCGEDQIAEFAQEQGFPIIPCTLCGTQPDLQRAAMKSMLDRMEERYPEVRNIAFSALTRIVPSHLLDRSFYDPDDQGAARVSAEEFQDSLPL